MLRGARRIGFIVLVALVHMVIPASGQDKTEKTEKENLVPFGQPFVAKVISVEEGVVKMIMKERIVVGGKVDFKDKEVSLPLAMSVKIRTEWHPPLVDGEGKLRAPTKEEKAMFKGADATLWGYNGTEMNLEPGRVVQVYLGKPKDMKDAEPVVRMLYVAKEATDDKVDPTKAVFGGGDDKPTGKEGENDLKPYGKAFVAKLVRIEKDNKLVLVTKERVLNNGQVQFVDKNITVPLVEETKIRIEWVPPVLDDEGNIKKLTEAEKTEMKGPDKLWGYTGELKSLQPERVLQVYMGKKGEDDPVVRMIYVGKMPGDDKIDPNNVAFTLGIEGEDPSKLLDAETKVANWGTTFKARVIRADTDKLTLQLTTLRNVNLWLAKNAKIRTEWVAPKVMPDGKIGKYTEAELAKLKGDDAKSWGYTAGVEHLEAGRIVDVTLGKIVGKKVNPFVTQLQIAKEPGDDQVNVNVGAFAKPVAGTLPRVEGDPDPKEAEGTEPFGAPFIGRLEGLNNNQLTVLMRARVFDGQKVEYKEQKVNYNLANSAIVRIEDPPFGFDDKGRIKTYKPEELKELQGPEHLWGFPVKGGQIVENLKAGSTVKIYLGKKKGGDPKDPPFIRMIFISKPPGANTPATGDF